MNVTLCRVFRVGSHFHWMAADDGGGAGCLTGLSDLTGRRGSGTSGISAEDPACAEGLVPPEVPDPPHNPFPPRYLARRTPGPGCQDRYPASITRRRAELA